MRCVSCGACNEALFLVFFAGVLEQAVHHASLDAVDAFDLFGCEECAVFGVIFFTDVEEFLAVVESCLKEAVGLFFGKPAFAAEIVGTLGRPGFFLAGHVGGDEFFA